MHIAYKTEINIFIYKISVRMALKLKQNSFIGNTRIRILQNTSPKNLKYLFLHCAKFDIDGWYREIIDIYLLEQ